jgi:hypothetical protein
MLIERDGASTWIRFELIWHQQQIEHWIRFGRDVAEKILDCRRRGLSFAPNSISRLRPLGGWGLRHHPLTDRHPSRC